jgi:hypothetical protein
MISSRVGREKYIELLEYILENIVDSPTTSSEIISMAEETGNHSRAYIKKLKEMWEKRYKMAFPLDIIGF